MPSIKALSIAALAAAMASPALAAQVQVSDGWFRALPAGLPAGGYFTLHNNADSAIDLTGASSPACTSMMLHESIESGGMGRMVMVHKVIVPAHGDVQFKPGGYHIMCMHPKPVMKPGATVPVTLEFADGSKATSDFAVKNAKGE